jgi:hypothetical protein
VEIKQRCPTFDSRSPLLRSSRQLIACGSADQSLRFVAKRSGVWRSGAYSPPLPDLSVFLQTPQAEASTAMVIVVQQKGKLQLSEPRYVDPSFFVFYTRHCHKMPNKIQDLHTVDDKSFDYVFEQNATVSLRSSEGLVRVNVYRPKTSEKVPVLITYGP